MAVTAYRVGVVMQRLFLFGFNSIAGFFMAGETDEALQTIEGEKSRASRTRKARHATDGGRRNRRATDERIENLKTLVAFFKNSEVPGKTVRDVEVTEIAQLLKFTKSGVRKYILELQDAGVVEMVYRGATLLKNGRPVYLFTRDEAALASFTQLLNDPEFAGRTRPRRTSQQSSLPPGCTIHIMEDDATYHPRRDDRTAFRHWMDVALYGPARVAA